MGVADTVAATGILDPSQIGHLLYGRPLVTQYLEL